ncbi:MAG: hypothetical protein ABI551_16770, partial [Polyangiaceae bacterium]
MSTAENEIDEKKNGEREPRELASDDEKPAKLPAKTATPKKRVEADKDDDEDTSDEADSEDDSDDEPPSSRKPVAKTRAVAKPVRRESAAHGHSAVQNVLTIARREMRSYFDSLIAYVVIGGSTLAIGIFFFLMQNGGFWEVDRASMA